MPNQPKKQRKNASHVTWNARMGGVSKLSSRMLVALCRIFIWNLQRARSCARDHTGKSRAASAALRKCMDLRPQMHVDVQTRCARCCGPAVADRFIDGFVHDNAFRPTVL